MVVRPPHISVKGRIKKDDDKGFKRLATDLNGIGTVTLGVQNEEAATQHPRARMTVGELAAVHELGLGVPARSWLLTWMKANEGRMMSQTAKAFRDVMEGHKSRKQALIDLGYAWAAELRQQIADGKITPPLAQATIDQKGHDIPLLDTATLVNAITYAVYLPQIKSIKDASVRERLRKRP